METAKVSFSREHGMVTVSLPSAVFVVPLKRADGSLASEEDVSAIINQGLGATAAMTCARLVQASQEELAAELFP